MDIKELSVGNFVYLKNGKLLQGLQVTGIGDSFVNLKISDKYPNVLYPLNNIEPIPLTKEILEKNGFEDVGQDIYQCEVKPYYIWWESDRDRLGIDKDESDYEKECVDEVMRLPITDVHELQNAMRLLGIDKEIVL